MKKVVNSMIFMAMLSAVSGQVSGAGVKTADPAIKNNVEFDSEINAPLMNENNTVLGKKSEKKTEENEKYLDLKAIDQLGKISNKDGMKINRKYAAFDTVNSDEEKIIEVNSVNFIQLKSKAGKVFVPDSKVADIDVIDDHSLLLMGLKPGSTSLIVNDKDGRVIASYKIRVTYPLEEIKNAVKQLYLDASLELIPMDDSVIMKGKVASPEDAEGIQNVVARFVDSSKIINKMEIATAIQVMLKVKIAEVTRKISQDLGLNWRAISFGNSGAGTHIGAALGTFSDTFKYDADIGNVKQTFTGKEGLSKGSWFIQSGDKNNLSAVLKALDTESFASILAEPTLVAISGQKATFSSGGEYGYKATQTSSGTTTTSTEFKNWGTSVEFTPTVLSENRIRIQVKPTVSSIGTSNDGIPSVDKKETETIVELGSGQSLAIAGLLQTSKSTETSRTPGLSNLPLIGSLFRESNVRKEQRESVIIVTPYIVKPSSKGLKAPTDSMTKMYSAVDVVLRGRSHAKAALSIK